MTKAPYPAAHYDLIDLRLFLAVADAGTVSHGAGRCHLAPSSASLRLKSLEAAIGTRLFDRKARGLELTRAGLVLLDHARRCIAQLEQMHADMLPFAQGLTGHLTLFANNNAISSHLPNDLARYFAAHPSVRITLQECLSADIVAAVAAGRADAGVVAMEAPLPELDYLPYRTDELVVLAPRGNALAKRKSVRFIDCLDEPFISLQSGAALHTFLVNHAAALGGRLDIRVQVSGYRDIARLVSSGAGIGVVPRTAMESVDQGLARCIELKEVWARRELCICVRRDSTQTRPFLRELIEVLCPRDSKLAHRAYGVCREKIAG